MPLGIKELLAAFRALSLCRVGVQNRAMDFNFSIEQIHQPNV